MSDRRIIVKGKELGMAEKIKSSEAVLVMVLESLGLDDPREVAEKIAERFKVSEIDPLVQILEDHGLSVNGGGGEQIAEVLRSRFMLEERTKATTPFPEDGQLWRESSTGQLVKIVSVSRNSALGTPEVAWEDVNGRLPVSGFRPLTGWADQFEFVAAESE